MPRSHVPSGNSPFSPLSVFLPRNQPSPKSSSRSTSSMRSPRLRLSSSGLRATNSSAAGCQHRRRSAPHALRWSQSSSGARWRGGGGLTHDNQQVARPAVLRVGAQSGGHGHGHGCAEGRGTVRPSAGGKQRGEGVRSAEEASDSPTSATVHHVVI
jgi:hypothetical protein